MTFGIHRYGIAPRQTAFSDQVTRVAHVEVLDHLHRPIPSSMFTLIMAVYEDVVDVFSNRHGFPLMSDNVMPVKVDETEHLLHPEAELRGASPAAGLLDLHQGRLDLGIRGSGDEGFVPLSRGQVGLIGVEDVLEDASAREDVEVDVRQVAYG